MEKPPKMYTRFEWEECELLQQFNQHHGTKVERFHQITDHNGKDLGYEGYKLWYTKTFTKLGRALQ